MRSPSEPPKVVIVTGAPLVALTSLVIRFEERQLVLLGDRAGGWAQQCPAAVATCKRR
jgi:hypothetical protein